MKLKFLATIVFFIFFSTSIIPQNNKKIIRMAFSGSNKIEIDYLNRKISQFNKKHSNIEIRLVSKKWTAHDPLYSYMRFFSFENCAIDIFYCDTSWIPLFVSHDWVLPLDQYISNNKNNFVEVTIDAATFDNKLYALPYNLKGNALFYRSDLLEKYGYKPPENFSQLISISLDIKHREKIKYGTVFHAKYIYNDFLPFFWSNNGCITDKNSKTHVNSPENIYTLNLLKTLVSNNNSAGLSISEFKDWRDNHGYRKPLEEFINGNAVFMINWSTRWDSIKKNKSIASKTNVTSIPSIRESNHFSTLGAWYFAINKNTEYPQEATDFIMFLLSDESQKERLQLLGEMPSLKTFYTDEKNIHHYNDIFPVKLFYSILSKTKIKIPVANEREIGNILDNYLFIVLSNKISPQKALSEAHKLIENSLKRISYNYNYTPTSSKIFNHYELNYNFKYPLYFIALIWLLSIILLYFIRKKYNLINSISKKIIITGAPITILTVLTVSSLLLSLSIHNQNIIYTKIVESYSKQVNEYVKMIAHKTALSSSVLLESTYKDKSSNNNFSNEIQDILSFAHYNSDILFTQIIKNNGDLFICDKDFLFESGKHVSEEESISDDLKMRILNLKTMQMDIITSNEDFDIIEVLNPIFIKGAYFGAVRIGFSLKNFKNQLNSTEREIVSTIILSIIITLLLTIFIGFLSIVIFVKSSLAITNPIKSLTYQAREITNGNYDKFIEITNSDETGHLAKTLNYMSQILTFKIVELEETNKRLTEIDKLKDSFLANTSHELRTPLHGIIGLSESLLELDVIKSNNQIHSDLLMILNSSQRLANLVNDILDFSKLKVDDISLSLKTVDLHTLSSISLSLLQHIIKSKNLEIINSVPSHSLVIADEQRLQQIVLNLISNAVKFTTTGTIEIYTERSDNQITFHVKDTGIGIAKNNISKIFDSFSQEDGSISREYNGTGLGLAISQKLIELHGSKIHVISEKGQGSDFHFTLPISNDNSIKHNKNTQTNNFLSNEPVEEISQNNFQNSTQAPEGKKDNNISILVVDDEPVNLKVLINHLTFAGYNVITATNGKSAIEIVNNQNVDLILLDVMMPGMSGIDVCKYVREQHSPYELPIIFLTAKSRTEDIVMGIEQGANDYLTKPVNRNELLARVNNLNTLKKSVVEHNELSIIKQELKIAHNLQQSILRQNIPSDKRYNLSIFYEPTHHLGGDFYDVRMPSKDILEFFIADVSGHGIPAAFISGMLKVSYSFHIYENFSAEKIMERINNSMYFYTQGKFITSGYCRIDFSKMELTYCNAGHWPLLHIRNDGNEINQITTKGHPIGWSENKIFTSTTINLQSNDLLIFYTDGIIEVMNKNKELFGEDNFHKIIKEYSNLEVNELKNKVIADIAEWADFGAGVSFDDDITLAALRIKT